MKGTKSRDALVISKRFLISIIAITTILIPTLSTLSHPIASAAPSITEYPLPFPIENGDGPGSIVTASDGSLWFSQGVPGPGTAHPFGTSEIVQRTPSGTYNQFHIPNSADYSEYGASIGGLAFGSDGALWFTDSNTDQIERFTTSGQFSAYQVPSYYNSYDDGDVLGITAGPDGALWFTMNQSGKIGQITTSGAITEYSLPSGVSPDRITSGPDGALWFTYSGGIGRITTSGVVTQFALPSTDGSPTYPTYITAGPDGALWFTEVNSTNAIGRITTEGAITSYPLPASVNSPGNIVTGADGSLWFSEEGAYDIGNITTSGLIFGYSTPTSNPYISGMTAGADGAIWFSEESVNQIGRLSLYTAPTITSPTSYSTGMRTPITPSDFTVTTTGTPTATITESGALPAGISFVDNGDGTANFTGMASGNPTSNGTYPITITATNSAGSTTQNFTLTITTATSPPTFVSSNTATESFGVPFSYTIITTGYPVPSSLHKVEGDGSLPPGVSFVNNGDGTGTLSGYSRQYRQRTVYLHTGKRTTA